MVDHSGVEPDARSLGGTGGNLHGPLEANEAHHSPYWFPAKENYTSTGFAFSAPTTVSVVMGAFTLLFMFGPPISYSPNPIVA